MGKHCAAIGCTNTNTKLKTRTLKTGVTFHSFPLKNPELLKTWVQRMRRDFAPTPYSFLCSEHFTENDFQYQKFTGMRMIKRGAIPSKFCFTEVAEEKPVPRQFVPTPWKQPIEAGPKVGVMRIPADTDFPSSGVTVKQEVIDTAFPEETSISRKTFETGKIDNDIRPSHLHHASRDGTTLRAALVSTNDMIKPTRNDDDQVFKMKLPFKDREVRMLLVEYLYLYETFQHLKKLARINVGLLYHNSNSENNQEVKKVQELIQALLNGRKIFKIELSNLEENVSAGVGVDLDRVKHQNRSQGRDDEDMLSGNEINTSHDLTSISNGNRPTPLARVVRDEAEPGHSPEKPELISYWESDDFTKSTSNDSLSKDIVENLDLGKEALASNTESMLDKPVVSIGDDSPPQKDLYGKSLNTRIELQAYLESPTSRDESGSRICWFCNQRFTNTVGLSNHLIKHLENKLYVCSQCGKEFKDRALYRKHTSTHNRKFDEIYLYNNPDDESSQNSEAKECHKCVECHKEFLHEHLLNQHKQLAHAFYDRSELCSFCGITFKRKRNLLKHLQYHEEGKKNIRRRQQSEKTCMCDICGKTFARESSLLFHKKMSGKEGPELKACPVCGKMVRKLNYKRHLRVHSDDKPNKCSFCHKGFADVNTLDRHLRRHTGLYPYRCSICNMGCHAPSTLRMHERLHTRESSPSTSTSEVPQEPG